MELGILDGARASSKYEPQRGLSEWDFLPTRSAVEAAGGVY